METRSKRSRNAGNDEEENEIQKRVCKEGRNEEQGEEEDEEEVAKVVLDGTLGSVREYLENILAENAVDGGNQDARFAVIGSRALRALSHDFESWYPKQIPIPAYVPTDRTTEFDKQADSDYDLIGTPRRVLQYLDKLEKAQLVKGGMAIPERRRVVVSLQSGETLDVELVLPPAAFNVTAKTTSGRLLVDSATTASVKVHLPLGEGLAGVPDVSLQFAVRRSHIYFPIKWRKHIEVLHAMLRKFSQLRWEMVRNSLAHSVKELRYKELVGLHGVPGAHISLDKTNDEFFSDMAGNMVKQRKFNHDRIHEHVAYFGRPLYERFKVDQSRAMLDKGLFDKASENEKLRLVREECMAIALERFLLPGKQSFKDRPDEAYWVALERVCTTLTKGWFRTYAAMHYPKVKYLDRDLMKDVEFIHAHPEEFAFTESSGSSSSLSSSSSSTTAATASVQMDSNVFDDLIAQEHKTFHDTNEGVDLSELTDLPPEDAQSVLAAFSELMRHTTQRKEKVTKTKRKLSFILHSRPGGPPVPVHCEETLIAQGWSSSETRGRASINVSVNLEPFMQVKVFRKKEWFSEYEDSGCEWGGGYYVRYSEVNTKNGIEAFRLNKSLERLYSGHSVPPGLSEPLFAAFVLHMAGLGPGGKSLVLNHQAASRALQIKSPRFHSAPDHFALALSWESKFPSLVEAEVLRLASDLSLAKQLPPRSRSPAEIQMIQDTIRTSSRLRHFELCLDPSQASRSIIEALKESTAPLKSLVLVRGNRDVFNSFSRSTGLSGRAATMEELGRIADEIRTARPSLESVRVAEYESLY